jgi:hypothetical protein
LGATASWLAAQEFAHCSFVLVLDGVNLGWCTTGTQVTGTGSITAAWSSTDWTSFRGGLDIVGTIERTVQPFEGTIEDQSLTFTVVDHDGAASQLFRDSYSSANKTVLTADLDSDATTVTVKSTTGFASSGHIYIGATEAIAYAAGGGGGTTFTTCTRGKWSIGRTSTDARFGRPHLANSGPNTIAPVVSDTPLNWYNRGVALYLVHYRGGAWETVDEAELLWTGRIKAYTDEGDGRVSIECRSLEDSLRKTLLGNRYEGKASPGIYLTTETADIVLTSSKGTSQLGPTTDTLTTTGSLIGLQELVTEINVQLAANDANVHGVWSLVEGYNAAGAKRFIFRAYDSAGASGDVYRMRIALSAQVWEALGFYRHGNAHDAANRPFRDVNGRWVLEREFSPVDSDGKYHELAANGVPKNVTIAVDTSTGELPTFTVSPVTQGTFRAQPTMPSFAQFGDGFLRIGDGVFLVQDLGGNDFEILDDMTWAFAAVGGDVSSESLVIEGSATVPVKQVWFETGTLGDFMRQLMLSTGTNGFNEPDDDVYPVEMSIGMPYSLVDATSWALLEMPYDLILLEPTPFLDLLESALSVAAAHLVFRDGKLTVRPCGALLPASMAVCAFTEDNKARPNEHPRVVRNASGIVNRAVLKFSKELSGDTFTKTIQANALASQGDFAATKTITIKALGIYSDTVAEEWSQRFASTVLAYFSRPVAVIERSYDFSLETQFAAGDLVTITDNSVIDPSTGLRGVTELPCWVLSKSFDWVTGVGNVRLAFLPELADAVSVWAPSARVDETDSTGSFVNGYNASTKTVRFKSHEYSLSTDDADASWFAAGDKVRIIRLGQTSPTAWADTIVSVSGNDVVLTTGLAGWTGTGYYVMQFDDVSTVTAGQVERATFLADDADDTTGLSGRLSYRWAGRALAPESSTIVYTQPYRKNDTAADDKGEPLSVHVWADACNSLNNHAGYGSRVQVTDAWDVADAVTQTGTTWKLAYGPVFMPLYGGSRQLLVKVFGAVDKSANCTARVIFSKGLVRGASSTTTSYPEGSGSAQDRLRYVDLPFTNTTAIWSGATLSAPWRMTDPETGLPGAWVTVEIRADADVTATISFAGLSICEAAL